MKSLFRSLHPLQHQGPGGSSIHHEADFGQKADGSLIERNPVAALCLTVGASLMAGTAWTAMMLWWTHQ